MPQLRQNMATKEWVVISVERARRPEEFVSDGGRRSEELPPWQPDCPFCPNNEAPDEVERLRIPEDEDWQIRVLRNRYPALSEEGEFRRKFDGVHRSMSGVGYHEVVIESRLHNYGTALQRAEEVQRSLQAFQIRSREIAQDGRVEDIILFKNKGERAGSSLEHPHAQLIALPVVPYRARARAEEARRFFDDTGECAYCRMFKDELAAGKRLVVKGRYCAAFVLYAAFSPFHLWLVPRRHEPHFWNATANELVDIAEVLRDVLWKIYAGLNDPDYNFVIHSAPLHDPGRDYMHWYITIVARVTRTAGFEMGTGMFINTSLPEESARFLREVPPWPGRDGPLLREGGV